MKLSGSYQINLSKEKVWEALNNPEILKKAIPGCEEFTKNSDTEFTAKATNKIGPFNASFTGDVELKDLNPPNSYKITGSGNSPVGFASGEAFVGGKIAQVGSRLIDMTAKKMADIFFGKFSELISATDDTNKDLSSEQLDNSINKQSNAKSKIWMYSAIVAGALILSYLIF